MAIGEDEGLQQGQWLGVLMEDLLKREDGLEEQHQALERHRLAALVQASTDGPQEPPPRLTQSRCNRFERSWSCGNSLFWTSTGP